MGVRVTEGEHELLKLIADRRWNRGELAVLLGVTEVSVTATTQRLRQKFGEESIETIPRLGMMFHWHKKEKI